MAGANAESVAVIKDNGARALFFRVGTAELSLSGKAFGYTRAQIDASAYQPVRDGVVVQETEINTLQREKDAVTEVREGYECGLTLTYSDIKEGDVIETYELVEKERV